MMSDQRVATVRQERGKKLDRRQAAEAQILETASELVADRGSILMTLADVGVRAGYSRALPAHYFGNKEGLVSHLTTYLTNRFRKLFFRDLQVEEGLPGLLRRVEVHVEAAETDSVHFRAMHILFAESTTDAMGDEAKQSLVAVNRDALRRIEHQIIAAQKLGEVDPDLDPHGAAIVIIGAARGAMGQYFLDPEGCDVEAWKGALITLLRNALTPRTAVAPPQARRAAGQRAASKE